MITPTLDGDGIGGERVIEGVMSDVSKLVSIQDINVDF